MLSSGQDVATELHSWSLHKVKEGKTPGCVGGQCFSTPRPSAEAAGTWWMLREGESFPPEGIPTGKLSVAVAGPMSIHICAKRAQWIMEKEKQKET